MAPSSPSETQGPPPPRLPINTPDVRSVTLVDSTNESQLPLKNDASGHTYLVTSSPQSVGRSLQPNMPTVEQSMKPTPYVNGLKLDDLIDRPRDESDPFSAIGKFCLKEFVQSIANADKSPATASMSPPRHGPLYVPRSSVNHGHSASERYEQSMSALLSSWRNGTFSPSSRSNSFR